MDEVGFPLTQIDPQDLESMASIFATSREVADFYRISHDVFEARLLEEPRLDAAWKRGRAIGRLSLRQAQFDAAQGKVKGNAAMLIWLGKQADVLAQEERPAPQTRNLNVNVKYAAEWGAPPGTFGGKPPVELDDALMDEEVLEEGELEDVAW